MPDMTFQCWVSTTMEDCGLRAMKDIVGEGLFFFLSFFHIREGGEESEEVGPEE